MDREVGSGRVISSDEREFLAAYDPTKFESPSVAVDVVLLTVETGHLSALLVRREEHPSKGAWVLPGGFVRMDESLDQAAARVLAQKASLHGVYLEQLYTFGAVDRDPRTRVISVSYFALVECERLRGLGGGEDAAGCLARLHVAWEGEAGGDASAYREGAGGGGVGGKGVALPLGFDHAAVLGLAVKRLRGKLDYAPIGFELLPDAFTLRGLQSVHETILGRSLNKDAFRRRMLATGMLEALGQREAEVGHRPAELYRFVTKSAR